MDLKNIESVNIANKNIVKIISGGVVLWISQEQAEVELVRAADSLTVGTEKGRLKSINFYPYTPDSGRIVDLPTTIEGYVATVTWDGVYTTRLSKYGREDFVMAKVSSPLTNKTESRVFRSRYIVSYED